MGHLFHDLLLSIATIKFLADPGKARGSSTNTSVTDVGSDDNGAIDVNKMIFKINLPVMVFIYFKICLPAKKKIKPNRPPKQPKSVVNTIKKNNSSLNLNTLFKPI